MRESKQMCFVIMPFVPELHYFYLYLSQYIYDKYGIRCERADNQVLTIPVLEKINSLIKEANVIIADCSGRNPNVYYELGIAHTCEKKVILITKDPIEDAPSDIRHYEFIRYELDRHREFLEKLDNAFHNIFMESYESLYKKATEVFREFKEDTQAQVELTSKEVFMKRVMIAERTEDIPSMENLGALRDFILPKIIADVSSSRIIGLINQWLSDQRESY